MASAEGQRASSSGRKTTKTADYQYNASNKTINKFLGSRQRPWMNSALPVKPTPRPPNRPPKESLPALPPVRVTSSQQSQPHQQHRRPSVPVAQATEGTPAAAGPVDSQLAPQSHAPRALAQTSIIFPATPAVLPSPAPTDEPSPAVSALLDVTSPPRIQPLVPENTSSAPVTSARFELSNPIDAVGSATTSSVQLPSNTTATDVPATTTTEPGAGSRATTAPSPSFGAATTLQTPPTPSALVTKPMPVNLAQIPDGNQEPPAKRRRTGNMAQNLLVALNAAQTIDRQVQQSGGENGLILDVERPRYQLLKMAITDGDLFFVVLHQVFCSWSYSNSIAHDLCADSHLDPSLIDNAFGLVGTILKSNSRLRAEHAQFFRNFPTSLEVLRTQIPLYGHTISQVLMFLTRLSCAWMIVNNEHKRSGYPLLMDELLSTFGLYSTTLQSIVFRASRRTLGVADGTIGQVMDELFRQDQLAHMDPHGLFFTRATENFQAEPHNKALIYRYCTLVAEAHASRQASQQSTRQPPDHQQQEPRPTPRMNAQALPANNNPPNVRQGPGPLMAPIVPGNGQIAQSSTDLQFTSVSPAGNQTAFAPNVVGQRYQIPSAQHPVLQGNPSVNSPTQSHFSNAASPVQSPIMTQGQNFQVPGRHAAQFAAGAQPSPPQNFQQQLPPRRTSQHFQVPSSQSPQLQNLIGLPQQARISPIQNNMNQVQQQRIPGRSSPHLQAGAARASPQLRQATTSSTPIAQNSGIGLFPVANLDTTTNQPTVPAIQQLQQQILLGQQVIAQVNQVRQSNVRPRAPSARPFQQVSVNGTAVFDYRRTPAMQIPATQYPHDSQDRKSMEMSLHQAHLRSPRRLLRGVGFSSAPERYYQFIKYLALQPTPIPQQKFLHAVTFDIPDSVYHKISNDTLLPDLSAPSNLYFNGSLRVRLRVSLVKRVTKSLSEEDWVLNDTYWPEHIHMQLNQQPLMVRRKQHHAKDQPIELGGLVRLGENVLKISVPVQRPFENNAMPFVGVEIIETLSHSSIYALPNLGVESIITSGQTRAVIQKRLGGISDPNEDEIAMVSDDLSINLADPFSYSLWNIPVRGKDCTHLECFDLETWLETRPGKKSCSCGSKKSSSDCKYCPKEPSLVDKWKCPLCQGDARPYSLRIDGFLSEVRKALAEQGLLRVKEIRVTADGSWHPVIPDDDDDFDSDENVAPNRTARTLSTARSAAGQTPQRGRPPIEVICLDDD
ncbi:putative SP-RING-type domain-containing protein [Seiridium cardinale]|uniref:SP-RING-type domain-containing protein n=1 Tax=Seiridium cardinale TaxID=138064 RepID=A0ABR2XLB9_9PEZI